MFKTLNLSLLPLICFSLQNFDACNSPKSEIFKDAFICENEIVVGLDDRFNDYEEIRIYQNKDYHILDTATFNKCTNLKSVMISFCIDEIIGVDYFVNNDISIYYTGSLDHAKEINLFPVELNVYDYAYDEGFFQFWRSYIKSDDIIFCDFDNYELFVELSERFNLLKSSGDYDYVASYIDGENDETILKEIKYLESRFVKSEVKQTKEANRSNMLIIILLVASLGMSAITILYLFKQRKIIE